mmetsp:Transcript_7240/g.23773  ORF Transcript_7240/g.23773 Transcript_7240/m.23773 type:complete len:203 (+) Transcript_7240:1664-2272(+)|eukprot:scaffold6454_cov113-Isochrysis_galbana.AAC.12
MQQIVGDELRQRRLALPPRRLGQPPAQSLQDERHVGRLLDQRTLDRRVVQSGHHLHRCPERIWRLSPARQPASARGAVSPGAVAAAARRPEPQPLARHTQPRLERTEHALVEGFRLSGLVEDVRGQLDGLKGAALHRRLAGGGFLPRLRCAELRRVQPLAHRLQLERRRLHRVGLVGGGRGEGGWLSAAVGVNLPVRPADGE